ncbi:MAG: xanthine dehydrogenase family protein subunit M [Gammaproteobacteria bacterium]|nr:xanthine dehydrogenase family protein subunit M [Gammaproteobacteria bacterium]
MIAGEFEFCAPKTLAEALALLGTHGSACKLLAGGMTLVPVMTLGLAQPAVVVSLNHLSGLDGVEDAGGVLRLGAMLRHATVAKHPSIREHLPLLAAAAAGIGDVQVRHRGTLGGSLVHAEPAADYLSATATLGARLCVRSTRGERWLTTSEFFVDVMTTALAPDEILTAIEIPKQPAGSGSAHKTLRRVEGAFPIVLASAAIGPGLAPARVGIGGVGPRPVVLDVADELRRGAGDAALAAIGDRAFEAAQHALTDLNGSGAYRREMARVYAKRAVTAALANLRAGGRS